MPSIFVLAAGRGRPAGEGSMRAHVLRDDRGAAAVEYSLIAALVSIAAIVALQTLGGTLAELFSMVGTILEAAASLS
jgi:pilus assembly protein Flp/PilA